MIITIPDNCGQCELTEPAEDGKLYCRYKGRILTSIGAVPTEEIKVDPEDIRPDICPYNQIIKTYIYECLGNKVKE